MLMTADLCVSPGEVGLTAMHALAYGTPVVTHDDFDHQKPEAECIVPGQTGAFFRRADPAHLANTLFEWLSRGQDREVIRTACYDKISILYNPNTQAKLINKAVRSANAGHRAVVQP